MHKDKITNNQSLNILVAQWKPIEITIYQKIIRYHEVNDDLTQTI